MVSHILRGTPRHLRAIFEPLLVIIAIIGVVFFAKGFLHVRRVIDDKSECRVLPVRPLFSELAEDSCWLPASPKKFVIIVIDALRIDFVLPSQKSMDTSIAWFDKLTILQELASSEPAKARLFHFVSDPPTATTQRLSSIAAGSLPAFIEMTANFAESSLGSDNLIYQLLDNPRFKKLDLYGDDTWLSLFPIIEEMSQGNIKGYHSFHLFDLHTVDNGIKEHIFPALEKNNFDIIVAHFLGFDHCGHKYGPKLPACGDKLVEMDLILREIIGKLDDETTLIVFGDHGMTDDGDHGGISDKEVGSVLFTYQNGRQPTKVYDKVFWEQFSERSESRRRSMLNIDGPLFYEETNDKSAVTGSTSQIDFTATFSLLAGIPIPFGSVGSLIPEVLINYSLYDVHSPEIAKTTNLRYLLDAARLNAHQVFRFIEKCKDLNEASFDERSLKFLYRLFDVAEKRLDTKVLDMSDDQLFDAFFEYYDFLLSAQKYCRSIWADFDFKAMYGGLSLGVIASSVLIGLFLWRDRQLSTWFALGIIMFYSFSLGSVAYVAFEDSAVRYMLSSIVLFNTFKNFVGGALTIKGTIRTLLALLIIRSMSYVGVCREEQFPHCKVIGHRNVPWDVSKEVGFALLVGTFGLLWLFRKCHSSLKEVKETAMSFVGHLLYFCILTLLGTHWIWTWVSDSAGESSDSDGHDPLLDNMMGIIVPRALFILCAVGTIIFRKSPSLILAAIASLAGTVLRPFSGWTLVVPGFALLRIGNLLLTDEQSPLLISAFYYLTGMHLFFVSGHQATITNLQWEAAFIGFRSTVQVIAGLLMILNTFSGPILATAALCAHMKALPSRLAIDASIMYMWICILQLVSTAMSSAILLRHLLLWKMFAPRFMMQALNSIISLLILAMCQRGGHRKDATLMQ